MNLVCRVCELLDNDTTIKEVVYCDTCKVYMCLLCEDNWMRRGRAAIIEKLLNLTNK